MAVAFDASSRSVDGFTTSLTVSHTVSGSDTYLLAFCIIRSTADKVSGITYNSTAMTRLHYSGSGVNGLYIYGLAAPASGTHNIVYTLASAAAIDAAAMSFTGVHQTTSVTASVATAASFMSSPLSISATIAAGGMGALFVSYIDDKSNATSPQSGQTEAFESDLSLDVVAGGYKPGSASTLGVTWTGGNTKDGGHAYAVLAPVASVPVITGPSGAATGNTTANAGATIDTVSGSGTRIMYALPRIGGSAASAATIKATGTQLAVTSSGAKLVALTGLTNGSSYSADIVYSDATLGDSNVVTATWTQTAAPVLSSPTNTPGSTTALIGATTNVTSGTAYFLARVGGSAASAATIIATGQTSAVSTTTPSRTVTGLTASTANNYVDVVQVSGVTTSNVVSAGPFTTSASGDTTAPVLTGSIVIGTVSSTSIQFSWPAGSDNVAVTSYEVSKDGGTNYVDAGNVLTYTFTGLTASTSYPLRVRAKDAAGNVSTPALAATQSTSAASGVGYINLNNAALYVFKKNNATVISSTGVTFWVSDVTTGALVGSAITGLSTNALGLVTTAISNASMTAGTTYRLSYEFSSGEYGCAKLPAV